MSRLLACMHDTSAYTNTCSNVCIHHRAKHVHAVMKQKNIWDCCMCVQEFPAHGCMRTCYVYDIWAYTNTCSNVCIHHRANTFTQSWSRKTYYTSVCVCTNFLHMGVRVQAVCVNACEKWSRFSNSEFRTFWRIALPSLWFSIHTLHARIHIYHAYTYTKQGCLLCDPCDQRSRSQFVRNRTISQSVNTLMYSFNFKTQNSRSLFIRVMWLVQCDVNNPHAWRDAFMYWAWHIHMCELTCSVRREQSICMTWCVYMFCMAYSYASFDEAFSWNTLILIVELTNSCGMATISRLLQIIGLFCKI